MKRLKLDGLRESLSLLRIRDFRLLLISNPLMFAAFQIRNMSNSWLALEETGSSVWVGILIGIPGAGIVVMGFVGGVFADRMSRRVILYRSKIVLSILGFATGYLVFTDQVEMWHLLLLGLGAGLCLGFMDAAAMMMPMDIVGKDRLMPALSFNQALGTVFRIAGPALGGMYLALFGLDTIFFVMGGMYIVAAWVNFRMETKTSPPPDPDRPSQLAQIKEGLAYVWATPHIRWLVIFSVVALFVGAYPAVVPVLVREHLDVPEHLQEYAFGAMLASNGAGATVALVVILVLGNVKRKGRMIFASGLFVAFGHSIVAFAPNIYLACFGALFVGVAGATFSTAVGTLIQTSVDDSMRGRVGSVIGITFQLFVVGAVLGGILTAWIGPTMTLLLFAFGTLTTTAIVFAKSSELRAA